jgi:cytochrome c2
MLPGLYHDINFTKIDRVDRCMTCHLAARRTGFEGADWKEPLRSHPRLDLFVGDTRPTPTGASAAPSATAASTAAPSSRAPATARRAPSESRLGEEVRLEGAAIPRHPDHAAGDGLRRACRATPGGVDAPGRDAGVGPRLITHLGCYGCHKIDLPAYTDLRRAGPSLRSIAAKTNPGWAYKWVEAPRDFHPTTFMPHFFFQENIKGETNEERQRAEIRAAVAYLWAKSETRTYAAPPPGDAAAGKRMFETVGCTGCHILDGQAKRDDFFPQINRLHGPNLVRTGSKVNAGWLYAWVRNPKQYFPETNMPNLRLTDQEAADVVAYLLSSRDPDYETSSCRR